VAFVIRSFEFSDARAWLEVHRAAILAIAAPDYPRTVIKAWAPRVTDRRIKALRSCPSGTKLVAELDGELAGIAELAPNGSEVRACYVSPRFVRRGVGKSLMKELEAQARAAGCAALSVHSSVSAEPFYACLGYEVTGRGTHALHTGEQMACVFMRKAL
jgi:putative acetyltransferase